MLTFQLLFPEFIASSEFWVLIFDKDSTNYNHMSFSLFLGQLNCLCADCVLFVATGLHWWNFKSCFFRDGNY